MFAIASFIPLMETRATEEEEEEAGEVTTCLDPHGNVYDLLVLNGTVLEGYLMERGGHGNNRTPEQPVPLAR
jgi:hypothetical protein